MADILPKEAMLWKLKLLKDGAAYANSRLHAIKAEVLLLARFLLYLFVYFSILNFYDHGGNSPHPSFTRELGFAFGLRGFEQSCLKSQREIELDFCIE